MENGTRTVYLFTKIRLNSLVNKFYVFNNHIDLSDLNLSYAEYKKAMKALFKLAENVNKFFFLFSLTCDIDSFFKFKPAPIRGIV